MLVKQKGIIIKTVDYGESDKIITILSESGAKIPLMVKRAKKSRTGMQANTQLFVYGLFISVSYTHLTLPTILLV